MKNLKEMLNESIFDYTDKNLWLNAYPLPKTTDFNQTGKGKKLQWYCKNFIQAYIDKLDSKLFTSLYMNSEEKYKLDTIEIMIYINGETRVFLTSKDNPSVGSIILPYIGTKSKKNECIKFLKNLATNENSMINMINYINKYHNKYRWDFAKDARQSGSIDLNSTLFD